MTSLGAAEQPLRVAIVGAGPSGFYAAESLLRSGRQVEVDIFDRLPSPYGLVRLGVAPDHQKIKAAIRVYEKIASNERVRFFGNVAVGKDITVEELRAFYHAVIFAHGAESDRRLNIPGEDLPGSHTATEFVGWYNGHPDYRDREFDLSQETAVVIGQGNVAVDVCRILCKTVDELRETDIAQHALEALAESKIRDVYMVGRRGPVQAKFTLMEVKELGRLEAAAPVVDPKDLALDPASQQELAIAEAEKDLAAKIVPVLREFSERVPDATKSRRLHFVFLRSPVELAGSGRVEKIVLERNELVGEPLHLRAQGTGDREELACGLVFRSVGYYGVPLPGLPFDEKQGVAPNCGGRVLDKGAPMPGVYVAGWIKRGPSGVIGTNKPDSQETVNALLEDARGLEGRGLPDRAGLLGLLEGRGVQVVSFADWSVIDTEEVKRGAPSGKPREKFTRIREMLDHLRGAL